MHFLHVINTGRQKRLLNVFGQIAMILGDKKLSKKSILNPRGFFSVIWANSGLKVDQRPSSWRGRNEK